MKNNFYKILVVLVVVTAILSACNGSRQSTHNHGVNNSGFKGY